MGELEGTLGALLKGITARVIGELVKTYGWKTAVLYMALAFAALFAAALAIRAIYKIARFALISAQRIFRKLNPQVAKASLVVTAAVTLGLLPLPYSYYILLRIIVCISAALAYAHANAHKRNNWQFIAGAIVVLYNPFVPVHLGDKGLWVLINAATVIMLWSAAYQLRSTVKKLGTYAPRTQEQDDPTWPDGDKDSRAFEQALGKLCISIVFG